jgi:hypothetical protein
MEKRDALYNSYTNNDVEYNAPSEYDANDLVSNLDNPGYIKESSKSWYSKAWNSISDGISNVGSDFANAGRMWTNKLID